MTKNATAFLRDRTYFVHDWLLRAGMVVTAEQFVRVFAETAPPIGWHLWHMARFADRLQAKLAVVTAGSERVEIWHRDDMPGRWHLSSGNLGVFETGMGQAHEQAQLTVRLLGQSTVMDYARAVFEAGNGHIAQLAEADFDKTYHGILDYDYDGTTGKVWAAEPKESTVAQDLIFHATHGSRHMGMMEALRGLLGTSGTLSV